MGQPSNAAHATHQQTRSNMQLQSSRSSHSSTAHKHVPLSPHSATRNTFHRSSRAASPSHCPNRNPLTPTYNLPAYPIHPPPPPVFLHSSLDTSDVSGSRSQRLQGVRMRDSISVSDIDGTQAKAYRRASSPGRQGGAVEATGLLRYVRSNSVDSAESEHILDANESFSPQFASPYTTSLPAPPSPPTRPQSSPPASTSSTTTGTAAAHQRNPYNRFAHSPHVLTPPTLPFNQLYQVAIRDTLPPFRYTLNRTSVLPSNYTPIGGVDATELDELGGGGKGGRGRGKGKCKGMRGVAARVECWRVSDGEVERSAATVGGRGSEWQRMRVQDIELVSSLSL